MRCGYTLAGLLGLALLSPLAPAPEATDAAPAAANESPAKTTYAEKERVVATSSGSSDLEFEGPAKTVGGDFEINGAKPVVTIGEGALSSILRELE